MPRVDSFKEAGKLIAHFVDVHTKDFLYDLWFELVELTPVDTGRARASWYVTGGAPKRVVLPDGQYDFPSPPDLDKYKRNYTKWFVSNTAPYIEFLNAGHSRQAPSGFIQQAIAKVTLRYK